MNSLEYISGFVIGVVIAVVIALLIRLLVKKKLGQNAYEYDERQKAIQGTGYKFAYFTLLICVVLGGIVETALGIGWIGLFPFSILCMWISISVFVTYCVIKDAYFTLQTKRTALMIAFLLIGLINIACVIFDGDPVFADGKFGTIFANLCTGVCTLYLTGVMLVKALAERRQDGEE